MADPTPAAAAPAPSPPPVAAPAPAKKRHAPSEMRFGSYPLFVLFWPLVLAGEICAWLVQWKPGWSENIGWVYITVMLTCFIAVGFDVRRNLAIGWLLFVGLFWVAGLYVNEAKHIPVLSHLREFLAAFDATVTPGFLHATSLLILIGLIGTWVNVMINHRWRVTHNELHLSRRAEGEDAIARGAKRISVEYPDVFELLLLGAGHVVVRDSKGREEIRRIPRVPLLFFRENQLDSITEAWAVTNQTDDTHEDEEG
jgi:hypothetical protein